MKSILILLLLSIQFVTAEQSTRTFDCTKIFEERKSELVGKLEHIDDQEQALKALKEATSQLLDKKKAKIEEQEQSVREMQADVKAREENITKLVAQNQQILEDIRNAKLSKVGNIYAKMKAGAAAEIFSKMDVDEAVNIISALPAKVLGKVFAKMQPAKAAELTSKMGQTK